MPSGAFYTADELLALLARNVDADGWLQPLLDDPSSAAVLGAIAAEMSRASLAVDRGCKAPSISDSAGGSPGTSTATLTRAASGTAGTIPVGYPFLDAGGIRLLAQSPVPVASGALTIAVPMITVRQSEVVNTEDDPALRIDPQAPIVLDAGATTVLIAPPGSAGLVSTSFSVVTSSDPIQGGLADWLSVLGDERGVRRQGGEVTGDYRLRVRNIPEYVSPAAVSDGVEAAASRIGLDPTMILEPFEDLASASVKADHNLGSFHPLYASGAYPNISGSPKADFLDDAARELVSQREARAYFRVVPPHRAFDPDALTFYCSGAPGDGGGFCDDPVFGYPDVGQHPAVRAALMGIWEEADRKRAGGVAFDVAPPFETVLQGYGETAGALENTVVSLAPPPGSSWVFMDAHLGFSAAYVGSTPTTPPPPAGAKQRLRITFADASTFTTDFWFDPWEQAVRYGDLLALGATLSQRIVLIEGLLTSDGAARLSQVVTARVLEFVDS